MKQEVVILILIIVFIVIVFGTAMSISVRAKGMKRVYWLLSSVLIAIGSLLFIYFLAFPEPARVSGEMPPELGIAGFITRTGVTAALLGFLIIGLWRLAGLFSRRSSQ